MYEDYKKALISSTLLCSKSLLPRRGIMDLQLDLDPVKVYKELDDELKENSRPFIFNSYPYLVTKEFFEKLKEEMPDDTNTDL